MAKDIFLDTVQSSSMYLFWLDEVLTDENFSNNWSYDQLLELESLIESQLTDLLNN